MNKTTKNCKVLALILLTSALLIVAAVPNVGAQTNDNVYIYTSIGGTISTMGTTLTAGTSYPFANGTPVTFDANASAGYQFLCWVTIAPVANGGPTANTTNPLVYTPFIPSAAVEAIFVPTTNATVAASTTGTSSIDLLISAGELSTNPTAGTNYTNYTVGTVNDFNATPGAGFQFLGWIVSSSSANNIYTSNPLSLNIPADTCAIQAMFVPTGSNVAVPSYSSATPTPIPEYSSVATVIIAAALVAVAFGTYTYRRKAKN